MRHYANISLHNGLSEIPYLVPFENVLRYRTSHTWLSAVNDDISSNPLVCCLFTPLVITLRNGVSNEQTRSNQIKFI